MIGVVDDNYDSGFAGNLMGTKITEVRRTQEMIGSRMD